MPSTTSTRTFPRCPILTRFPIDTLKIGKTLTAGLGVKRDDTVVVQAIIKLAHALDLTSVAEGVETADQLRVLADLGCDRAQGHHVGVPSSATVLTPLLDPGPAGAAARRASATVPRRPDPGMLYWPDAPGVGARGQAPAG
ncbi:MAG: EAL domain-containing protein [Frankiaceae bacterium]